MSDIPEQRRASDAVVSYSVAELLAGIRTDMTAGFTEIRGSLSNKADKQDLARINGRLDEHQVQIEKLRERQDADDIARKTTAQVKARRTDWHRWLYPTVATIALAVVTIMQATGVLG